MSDLLNNPQASPRTILDSIFGRLVVFTLFHLLYFIFLYVLHGDVLQSHLWNTLAVGQTWTYWQEVLTHPGALLEIASHRLPGYFSSLGAFALGLSLLSFCTVFLLDGCLQIIKPTRRSLLWPLLLLASFPLCLIAVYDFVYLMVVFFVLLLSLTAYLLLRRKRGLRLAAGLLLYIFLYFVCGNFFAYLFLLLVGLIEGKKLFSKELRLDAVAYLLALVVLPWIAYRWIFVQPLQDLYFLPPSNYAFSRPTIEPEIYYIWAGMSLGLLGLVAANSLGKMSPRFLQNPYIKGGMVLLSMGAPFLFTLSPSERDYYGCTHHFRHQQWEQVKSIALEHFQKRPPEEWKMTIAEEFKLSLWMERQLCDSLFFYDYLPGCQYLFPVPMQLNNELGLSEVYARVGLSGSAAHNAYKMASHASFLHQAGVSNVLLAEVVEGRDPRKHPYFSSLPHREAWLTSVLSDSVALMRKQLLSQQAQTLIHPFSLDFSIISLFLNSEYNPYAFDYVCALALINKDLKVLERWLLQLGKYGYTQTPRHLEEAIALMQIAERGEESKDTSSFAFDYTSDSKVSEEFQSYLDDKEKLQNNKISFPEFQQKYMPTYWFYYDFYTPPGQ